MLRSRRSNKYMYVFAEIHQLQLEDIKSYKHIIAQLTRLFPNLFFSVIDRNVFEMTDKNKAISVRMPENIGW